MYKTIFFDIGGVLLNIYPERTIDYLSSATKLSTQQIIDSFPEDEHHEYERGEIDDSNFYAAIKKKLPSSVGLTSKEFWKAWSLMVGERTIVADLMDKLKNNYSVWLLSNTNPYHIIKENRTEIFGKIDGAIYSYAVGCRKPELDIYKIALDQADTKPEHALFIDDLEENIVAAKSLNIDAIHYVSYEHLKDSLIKRQVL